MCVDKNRRLETTIQDTVVVYGLRSTHFELKGFLPTLILRLRHVRQPVLVRLLISFLCLPAA